MKQSIDHSLKSIVNGKKSIDYIFLIPICHFDDKRNLSSNSLHTIEESRGNSQRSRSHIKPITLSLSTIDFRFLTNKTY